MANLYDKNGNALDIVNVVPVLQTGTHIATINGKKLYAPNGGGGGGGTSQSFGSFRGNSVVNQDETFTLPVLHVQKNMTLIAKIKGTVDSVFIGVGYSTNSQYYYRGYDARWIELTSSQIKYQAAYNQPWITKNTYNHGLTLTNKTTVIIETTVTQSGFDTILKIYDDLGNVFSQTLTEWGVGMPFVGNNGSSNIEVDLSFFPRDLTKDVWCFGDSYFSFTADQRWPRYAREMGNCDWFSNNQPGLSPPNAYIDLENLLTLGYKPTYLLWALGMNGDTTESKVDGEYVINNAQKTVIDNVLSLCTANNILPVFCCIPTVPARQKTGFCKYVKSLGTRYVDFAEAVGTNENGEWNTGLLSSDQVHPTTAGAKVLYSRLVLDFPEISIVQ